MKKSFELYVHVALATGHTCILACEDMSEYGYAMICKHTVELDIPDFDIVQIQVDGIEQQIVKLRAEFQSRLKQLEDRKAELLAIGHDREAE